MDRVGVARTYLSKTDSIRDKVESYAAWLTWSIKDLRSFSTCEVLSIHPVDGRLRRPLSTVCKLCHGSQSEWIRHEWSRVRVHCQLQCIQPYNRQDQNTQRCFQTVLAHQLRVTPNVGSMRWLSHKRTKVTQFHHTSSIWKHRHLCFWLLQSDKSSRNPPGVQPKDLPQLWGSTQLCQFLTPEYRNINRKIPFDRMYSPPTCGWVRIRPNHQCQKADKLALHLSLLVRIHQWYVENRSIPLGSWTLTERFLRDNRRSKCRSISIATLFVSNPSSHAASNVSRMTSKISWDSEWNPVCERTCACSSIRVESLLNMGRRRNIVVLITTKWNLK